MTHPLFCVALPQKQRVTKLQAGLTSGTNNEFNRLGTTGLEGSQQIMGNTISVNKSMAWMFAVSTSLIVQALPACASTWLNTGSATSRPFGHIEYCKKRPFDCRQNKGSAKLQALSLGALNSVNSSVNHRIKPMRDEDQFGVRDLWSYGAKVGDCEDFAIAKRAALLSRGYRPENTLLAMGYEGGQAHVVLLVRTDGGDYVLDNLNPAVLPVEKSSVRISKVQSPKNGAEWLSVGGKSTAKPQIK